MKFRYLCLIIALVIIPFSAAAEETIHDKIRTAFFASDEVQRELERLKSRGYEPGRLDTITLEGTCSAAGCDYDILVVQTMVQKTVNRRASSVCALVQIKVPANIVSSVTLVDIILIDDKRRAKTRIPSSDSYSGQGGAPEEH